jgi:capsular exopolysaccharide synthesis family protein
MEMRYLWVLAKHWYWFVALTTILGAVVVFGIGNAPKSQPLYQASATLMINLTTTPGELSQVGSVQGVIPTYIEMAKSQAVLERVVEQYPGSFTVETLGRSLSAKNTANTSLLVLTAQFSEPSQARDVANAWAQAFMTENTRMGQESISRQLSDIEKRIATCQQSIKTTSDAIAVLNSNLNTSNQLQSQAELNRLQTELSFYEGQYNAQMSAYTNMLQLESRASTKIVLTNPAQLPPAIPLGKQLPVKSIVLGAIIGLLLGLGIAFAREYFKDVVKSVEGIESTIGLPVLAEIEVLPAILRGNKKEPSLVSNAGSDSSIAQAYRVLSANIEFACSESKIGSVLVTSSNIGEGVSTTVGNLAVAFAQLGRKVIVVDANLSNAHLHELFGVSNTRGLTDLFTNEGLNTNNLLQPTSFQGISILSCGSLKMSNAILLGIPNITRLIAELKTMADIVIVDGPPVLVSGDAVALTTSVDGVILLAEYAKTSIATIAKSVRSFGALQPKVVGTVLTKTPAFGLDFIRRDHSVVMESDKPVSMCSAAEIESIEGK